jgi:hypothetical protein
MCRAADEEAEKGDQMARPRGHIEPDRLLQAAEAALMAAEDVADHTGGPRPYPLDLMGAPLQPDCLSEFTRYEIQQACEFLVRLGELEPPGIKRKRKA